MVAQTDIHPHYITNDEGKKLSVVLPIESFEELLEDLNDLTVALERKEELGISHEELLEELEHDGLI